MLPRTFLDPILSDDRLTHTLGDPEARLLIEFLVDEAERLEGLEPESALRAEVDRLCRRGRVMGRVVRLWCDDRQRGAAAQLAASERMAEALPSRRVDPCQLMERLIALEVARRAA